MSPSLAAVGESFVFYFVYVCVYESEHIAPHLWWWGCRFVGRAMGVQTNSAMPLAWRSSLSVLGS